MASSSSVTIQIEPSMESDSGDASVAELQETEPKVEIASPSSIMEQPNMESDSADASNVEPQEIVDSSLKDSQTAILRLGLESLGNYLRELRNSSNQIPKELTTLRSLLDDTICVVEDAKRCRDHIILRSWLEVVNGVLFDTEYIFLEIKNANIFGQTAEVQSSANKPWKLILDLYSKISRFMHYYREKRMVSIVKYITDRFEETLDEGKQLLKETLDERTQSGIQYTSTTPGELALPLQILHTDVRTYLGKLRNSSNQIPTELIELRRVLVDTMPVVEDAERYRENIMVKLWLAEMVEVLLYTADIFSEIEHANIFGQTAEVQSSANKPWKLILNLFNKISRFMHYNREKWMVFKLKYRTAEIKENLDEGKQLLKEIPDEGTQFGPQNRSTTPDRNNLERKPSANAMLDAMGNYRKARNLFERNPADAISTTFENGQTALHVAIAAGQLRIAKKLITITSPEENRNYLRIKDKSGNTALSFAAHGGMMEIAKCLIKKNKNLLTIPDGDDKLPVQLACRAGHEDMTRYLYRETPRERLRGDNGFYLLEECINKKMFDIALHLLHRFPKFAVYRIFKKDTNPIILTLAQTLSPFVRGNQLPFWRRWIYNCTRVKVDKGSLLSDVVGIVVAQRRAKKIYDVKLMDAIAREILCFISRQLSALDGNEFEQSGAVEATFQAIKNGLPEIVIEIAKVNTNILWSRTDPADSMNMLECAIAHRQEEVAQFLYEFNARTSTNIVFTHDRDGNSLLYLAAKLAPRSKLDHISGAARLQSELRWFNAVKGIVPQFYNYHKNEDGDTPFQVFVKEHKKLQKEAEQWVKKTAESSTVVGTLIITIMFAVAFTVPGGNDQHTGFPIFLNKTTDSSTVPSPTVPFMIFVASDAISLFAASSSVLMFLGILASRYAYEDFFKSLPVKLIIGISSLFISIAAMMVAFCVALFIMLQGHLWIVIPVTLLAGIPIIIFVLLLSPFLVELYAMTFGPGIFDRKKNSLGKEEMESLQQ